MELAYQFVLRNVDLTSAFIGVDSLCVYMLGMKFLFLVKSGADYYVCIRLLAALGRCCLDGVSKYEVLL